MEHVVECMQKQCFYTSMNKQVSGCGSGACNELCFVWFDEILCLVEMFFRVKVVPSMGCDFSFIHGLLIDFCHESFKFLTRTMTHWTTLKSPRLVVMTRVSFFFLRGEVLSPMTAYGWLKSCGFRNCCFGEAEGAIGAQPREKMSS